MLTRAADDLILGSGLQVGSRMSSMRQVQVHRPGCAFPVSGLPVKCVRRSRSCMLTLAAWASKASCAQVGRRYELPPKPLTQQPPSLQQSDDAWRSALSAAEADVASGRCPSWGREPTVANCLMAAFQARLAPAACHCSAPAQRKHLMTSCRAAGRQPGPGGRAVRARRRGGSAEAGRPQ